MSRALFVLYWLLVGPACAEDELEISWDAESYFLDTDESTALFWTSPECPDDFGSIVVAMPPDWEYKTLNIECGKIVDPLTEEIERE